MMTMMTWIFIFGFIYLAALAFASIKAKNEHTDETASFVLGGSNLSLWLGVLTYSATLFSTFTLMGMPDFFRTHGIGAWIFLGVTDVAMAFVALYFGIKLRIAFKDQNYLNVSSFLKASYKNSFAVWIFLIGIFLFLIPYTAIQIRGIALFFEQSLPLKIPMWAWAVFILTIIMVYSSVGGFKAIVYSDAIQGVTLLFVAWMVAWVCLDKAGGFRQIIETINLENPSLLSVPGPKGLFTTQFLLSSFISIILMPMTQPQLTTRIMAMKDTKKLRSMAPSVAFFAIIVILPAMIMGLYGSIVYSSQSAPEFWANLLINDQSAPLAGLTVVGLLAAAMSTADSQLFSLGNETHTVMKSKKHMLLKTKLIIALFAIASLIFAIFTSGEIVPLARLSFVGTGLLAPLICAPIITFKSGHKWGMTLPLATLIALIIFLLSSFHPNVPQSFGPLRVDLWLFILLPLIAFVDYKRR